MAWWLSLLVGVALVSSHPGHGSMVLMGTLVKVSPDTIVLEVRDVSTGVVRQQRIAVTTDTKYREGKTRVTDASAYVGTRAVAAVEFEDQPDGTTTYHATEVRLATPKRKGR